MSKYGKFLTPSEQKEFEKAMEGLNLTDQTKEDIDYKPEEDNQKELFNNE